MAPFRIFKPSSIALTIIVLATALGSIAAAQPPGVVLYDPVPMASNDPYAIQPNGYFSPVQPLAPLRDGFLMIANPVPYRGRMFLRGEYLGWVMDPMQTPALVTTSPVGTPQNQSAFIGGTNTETLFGGEINDDFRNGFRVQGGWYVDPSRYWAIGGDYYQLFGDGDSFSGDTSTNPILGRPFFDIIAGRQTAQLVSYPALVTGGVDVNTDTQLRSFGIHIQADALNPPGAACQIASGCGREPRLDWLLGFRYVSLEDDIHITENLRSLTNVAQGTINLRESFETENDFRGVEVGAIREIPLGRFWFETVTKVALGTNAQKVRINGSTELIEAGVPETFTGALLAQRSNIGDYERDEFAVVPELGATLGFHVTPRFSLTVGYTFMYFSNVVRAGDQIDTDLNPGLIPVEADPLNGPLRPQFVFRQTDFFAQGVTAGADFRF
ncbi:MAG: BBP7 family outer membrane beta-barrel protein [Planctomycetaceae bacterium]